MRSKQRACPPDKLTTSDLGKGGGHSLANVHVWTWVRVLWSMQRRRVRGTGMHDSDYLQTAMLKVQHCPECSVIQAEPLQLFPFHTILTNERVLPCLWPAFCLFLQPLFQGSPRSEHRAPGPRDEGLHIQVNQLGSSYAPGSALFFKKMSLGQMAPPTLPPEKTSQLNFLPV